MSKSENNVTKGHELALAIAETIGEHMGERIRILDLRGLSDIADWFVIADVQSKRHLKALGKDLLDEIAEAKIGSCFADGLKSESWVILDLFDVVVHLFAPEQRDYYALDDYWGDAPVEIIETNTEEENAVL